MEEAWFIIIRRDDDPEYRGGAAWWREQKNTPWRCINVSSEHAWMLTTEAKDAVARLTREGFSWNKYECEVRRIG